VRAQSVFRGESHRAVNQNVGAGHDIDDLKGLAAAYIGRGDIASSDNANFQYVHCIS